MRNIGYSCETRLKVLEYFRQLLCSNKRNVLRLINYISPIFEACGVHDAASPPNSYKFAAVLVSGRMVRLQSNVHVCVMLDNGEQWRRHFDRRCSSTRN